MKRNKILIVSFFFAIIFVVVLTDSFFTFNKREAGASAIILKNGNLYSISGILGEKQLTAKGNVKLLFDQKSGKVIFGKGWEEETVDSERIGGTRLWIMNNNGLNELSITNDLVIDAFLDNNGKRIFYNTRGLDLYLINVDGSEKVKLQEKVLRPSLSPNGRYLTYQKLNSDWQIGQYYDQALGLAVLDLKTKEEKLITSNWEDFNPLWSPNGKKILFFSRGSEGLASHFIIDADGSNRKQLTNVGEKFVSDKTVDIPSERPIWSEDSKYLVYESDKEIWVNEFDVLIDNIVSSKQIAFGKNPQWLIDGEVISVVLTSTDKASETLIKIDLNGKIIK